MRVLKISGPRKSAIVFANKKAQGFHIPALLLAEDTGFEPADAFTSTVFKTAALNRSANPPRFSLF